MFLLNTIGFALPNLGFSKRAPQKKRLEDNPFPLKWSLLRGHWFIFGGVYLPNAILFNLSQPRYRRKVPCRHIPLMHLGGTLAHSADSDDGNGDFQKGCEAS